ncbi:MAG TPA: carboxylating nicotinate-nucleotide diphosphorylase [Bacteroidales bacterium]|nr:carboxylating nicotinate-nucleotide diphosphorylase [Bacteroidales bacterium]
MTDLLNLRRLIESAYLEDVGKGDHTSLACIPANAEGKARLLVKQAGILAGVEIAAEVFRFFDPDISLEIYIGDGQRVQPGDVAFIAKGKSRSLLTSERTVLNFMQRMSGIATETHRYAEAVKQYKAKILDTRKTTPGMRLIEKEAVRLGGGVNHRIGLYDMIMIKDNHVDFSGGISQAISRVHQYLSENNLDLKIEIEVRNFEELSQVLSVGGINRIMLDNFSVGNTRLAVEQIAGRYETESSGGIGLHNVSEYAAAGVDFISIGALTHHISSLDLSLKAF